jgi:hypothetical protein
MQSGFEENRFFIVELWTLLVLVGLVLSPLYAQDYPPDVARGKAVYDRHCQNCHGPYWSRRGTCRRFLESPPSQFSAIPIVPEIR